MPATASNYPFAAIVGQEEMKRALLIAAVDPRIGGVMVFGDRGTGKSTAVRGLADLLPKEEVVRDCPYRCRPDDPPGPCSRCTGSESWARTTRKETVPVVDLPLGATEDRVVGALDLERALAAAEKAFEPGLLARAHRGFLYVDEINLLEDHLVDLLLDVAVSGVNVVEREGLSIRHPARFVLIGSGNPEEGELRPQLLDRFGLAVDVQTPRELADRVEVVKRRDAYEQDPAAFTKRFARKSSQLRRSIEQAQARIGEVKVPDAILERAAALCLELGTDGLRGELTLLRAARAAAALDGEGTVGEAQLVAVAPLALRHRLSVAIRSTSPVPRCACSAPSRRSSRGDAGRGRRGRRRSRGARGRLPRAVAVRARPGRYGPADPRRPDAAA